MTYPAIIPWNAIRDIDVWLDDQVSDTYKAQPLAQDWARVAKAGEEHGEAIAALIGMTGQNPRKGFTHDRGDLFKELSDIAATAILAMQHFTKDTAITASILNERIYSLHSRIPLSWVNPDDL